MKITALLIASFLAIPTGTLVANANPANTVAAQDTVFHGGGCRKSSPPGQCCHMERRTGTVHCH